MESTTAATCTCTYENISVVAQLCGDPQQSESLVVYILRDKTAWSGRLSTVSNVLTKTDERLGSNCAATRGRSGASRAFRLLQLLGSSNASSRVVLFSHVSHHDESGDASMKLRLETNWGSEYGVKGLFLPVIEIPLASIGTPVFYTALFSACADSRSTENTLSIKAKHLKEEVQDLRRVYYDLLEPAIPLQRNVLSRTMAECLNTFKKNLQYQQV